MSTQNIHFYGEIREMFIWISPLIPSYVNAIYLFNFIVIVSMKIVNIAENSTHRYSETSTDGISSIKAISPSALLVSSL